MTREEAVQAAHGNIVTGSMFYGQAMAELCSEQPPLTEEKAEQIQHLISCAFTHLETACEQLTTI